MLQNLTNEDIWKRLINQLPNWFGSQQFSDEKGASVLTTILWAFIYTSQTAYAQLVYIEPQERLATMTDGDQLNLFAQDFFIDGLPRFAGENDSTYKKRIQANLLANKDTRQAMSDALYALTGFYPTLFEPWRPLDTGGYGGEDSTNYSMAYGDSDTPGTGVGSYGSGSYPYQGFVDVYVRASQAMGTYPVYLGESSMSPYDGIGCYAGETAPPENLVMWYGGESLDTEFITPAIVYQVINQTKVFGTVIWVAIHYVNEQP